MISICNKCFQRYQLIEKDEDQHLLLELREVKPRVTCPRCNHGHCNLVLVPELEKIKGPCLSLTIKQFYQATHGMGLPDEMLPATELNHFLLNRELSDAVLEERNGKVYLHELAFKDGTVVHLSAGLFGAQVLKVTKRLGGLAWQRT